MLLNSCFPTLHSLLNFFRRSHHSGHFHRIVGWRLIRNILPTVGLFLDGRHDRRTVELHMSRVIICGLTHTWRITRGTTAPCRSIRHTSTTDTNCVWTIGSACAGLKVVSCSKFCMSLDCGNGLSRPDGRTVDFRSTRLGITIHVVLAKFRSRTPGGGCIFTVHV